MGSNSDNAPPPVGLDRLFRFSRGPCRPRPEEPEPSIGIRGVNTEALQTLFCEKKKLLLPYAALRASMSATPPTRWVLARCSGGSSLLPSTALPQPLRPP